ncbi:MAG: hypothetical protein KF851_17065 [Pirellulaceae bacterium]|nr:hypothetical protein [Pirellulaceae bacterium]
MGRLGWADELLAASTNGNISPHCWTEHPELHQEMYLRLPRVYDSATEDIH